MSTDHPHRLGLIGCGRIGRPVIEAWQAGQLPGWEIAAVLSRTGQPIPGVTVTSDTDAFFSSSLDLIVEVAGPPGLVQHGARALEVADVWTVSATALADETLLASLEASARRHGHRLRILHGAIAGLDGVAAASVDPDAQLHLAIDLPPGSGTPGLVFSGTVREAARLFPDSVNVAVAAALAGPGPDRTRIEVSHPDPAVPQQLALRVESRYGNCNAATRPRVDFGHPVAASVISALQKELQSVWVG